MTETEYDKQFSQLCDELEAYCMAHNLPLISADEIETDNNGNPLSPQNKQWLQNFIQKWDANKPN